MKKRRLSFRLENDEAAVIAPVEFWDHLQEHCKDMAQEAPEYAAGWLDVVDHIRDWVDQTRDNRLENHAE